jgi:hypothetical protein
VADSWRLAGGEAFRFSKRLSPLGIDQRAIAIDLCFVMRENMMAAMLGEHSDGALRFASDVKRLFELHEGAIHQLNSQLTRREIEPRPSLLQNIGLRAAEVSCELCSPLGFDLLR